MATSRFFAQNFRQILLVLELEQVHKCYMYLLFGCMPDDFKEIVCYCRLSHRATFAWTALTHILGYENVFIYDGSWTEWGSIVGFPIER